MSGLTRARIEKGMSRKELGRRVGRSETSIGRYESGDRPMTDKMASMLAVELEVSPVDIKPDFNKDAISALTPAGQRLYLENLRMIFATDSKRKTG